MTTIVNKYNKLVRLPRPLIRYCESISPNGNLNDKRTSAWKLLWKYANSSAEDREKLLAAIEHKLALDEAFIY